MCSGRCTRNANWVTLALLVTSTAFAGPGQVGSSETSALSSDYEVLMAQKHELELRLSQDAGDYETYKALAENTLARLQTMNRRYQVGLVSADAVALVQSEVTGMNASCPVLLGSAQRLFNVGMKSRAQVQAMQSACEMLAR